MSPSSFYYSCQDKIKESFATGIGVYLTRKVYPEYSRQYFGNYTGIIEDLMDTDGVTSHNVYYIRDIPVSRLEATSQNKRYVSNFLAWIGNQVGVTYGDDGSSAATVGLVDVFDMYGVDCTYRTGFDANLAVNSIKAKKPVIIEGWRTSEESTIGHCWVADGYKRTEAQTTYYYYRSAIELSPLQLAALTIEDSNYSRTTTTANQYFHMNWGWDRTDRECNGFYLIDSSNWKPISTPYEYNLKMIYGFTKR